jgi:hypothetical protein
MTKVARLDNSRLTDLWQAGKRRTSRTIRIDKGHQQELTAFIGALSVGREMPIACDSLFATSAATLRPCEAVPPGVWSGSPIGLSQPKRTTS